MKKIFLYFMVLAAALSCNKLPEDNGDPASEAGMITEVISGSRGTSTKVTIADSDASFAWTVGDNIAVHVSNGTSHKYVFTSGEGGASEAAATADFTISYDEGYTRDAFAVYPSTIVSETASNYGQSGATLDVTLPGEYTLAQVSDETSPCPMIATNTPGTNWIFYQLCGLLRLTVNSIPPSTKRLEINFVGKNVAGNFAIPNPVKGDGSSTIAMENASGDNSSVITITNSGETLYSGWGDGKVFNIPLPAGDYGDITVTAYNELSGGDAVLTMTRPFGYTADCLHGTKRTASFPVFSINDSRSRRVIFAPGNLQATTTDLGATWTWGFAGHQYDFIGNGGGNTKINGKGTLSENGTVDLFGWSSAISAYGIHNSKNVSLNNNDYSGDFVDWGTIRTFDGITYPENYWKTLSSHSSNGYEWWYMLRTRSNTAVNSTANARYTLATINNDDTPVKGMIIFPDFYMGPTDSSSDITWGNLINNYNSYNWTSTQCTVEGWKTLESAGCVFLPAAGYREGSTFYNTEHAYASSTPGTAYMGNVAGRRLLRFGCSPYSVYWDEVKYKYVGASVRLAHEVQ